MPAPVKIVLSLLVLLVAGLIYRFRDQMDPTVPAMLVPALGIFMVCSLWVFPEAARRGEK